MLTIFENMVMIKITLWKEMMQMYRILIVDDEQIERDGVAFLINKYHYPFQIYTQSNGKNAMDFLHENQVDIICTDIKMPFMDGLELCAQARKLYPNIYLVLLTAYSDFEYARQAIREKVDEYLLKPVEIEEFQRVMENLLKKLDQRNEEKNRQRDLINRYKSGDGEFRKNVINDIVARMEEEIRTDADTFLFSNNQIVQSAAEIINREYASNITLEELSSRLHVSKGYLSTLFKEETTISIMQYITLLRMNRAEHLLRHTSMKVNEIAEAVGYHDSSYFGLQFKKFYGISPFQYRNGGAE